MQSSPQELAAPGENAFGALNNTAKPCGDCSLCCKVLTVTALQKKPGRWCTHHAGGKCDIHATKPFECGAFQCFWTLAPGLEEEWRPDRSKLVLWSDSDNRLIVDVDPGFPGAWRREPYYAQLKIWADRDRPNPLEVLIRTNGRLTVLFPEAEVELGLCGPDSSVDSGYRVEGGRRTPYARYVESVTLPA